MVHDRITYFQPQEGRRAIAGSCVKRPEVKVRGKLVGVCESTSYWMAIANSWTLDWRLATLEKIKSCFSSLGLRQ